MSEKFFGLTRLTKIYPVYFKTRLGVHTFGMKKAIDVFILDNENRVVKIRKNLKPGMLLFWNPKYSKVIEAPAKSISVRLLDKIRIL